MTQDDPTLPLPGHRNDQADPFDYGDRTLYFLKNQPFQVEEEFGTMVARVNGSDQTLPLLTANEEVPASDRERSVEQKIDAMLTRMMSIENRLASIDAALARVLNR
jgi:hypothetical protein